MKYCNTKSDWLIKKTKFIHLFNDLFQAPKKSAKKRLEEKIAEKERRAREEAEQRRALSEANLTPEERMAEKLRLKKMVEEQDLALAMETFGTEKIQYLILISL